jgi:hypothetical protein
MKRPVALLTVFSLIVFSVRLGGNLNAQDQANSAKSVSVAEALKFPDGGSKVLLSLTFEGKLPFELPPEYSIAPGEGVNGTSALKFARNHNKVNDYIALPIKDIVPGGRYQLRAKIRGKVVNVPDSNQKKPVVCGIEYRIDGKPVEVLYPLKPIPEDYEEFSYEFVARKGYEPNLVMYLWHDWSGEVFFDDVEIRSEGPDVSCLLLQPPHLTFKNGNKDFTVHLDPRAPLPAAILVTLTQNGQQHQQVLTDMDGKFNFHGSFPELVPGQAEIGLQILDLKERLSLYTGSFKVNVLPPDAQPPANAATFDEYGRLIVDGKPFMPLGVFGLAWEPDLLRLKEAGFNCLQLYPSLSMQGAVKDPSDKVNTLAGMDVIQKCGMKLLFSSATQLPGHGQRCEKWDGVEGVQEITLHAVEIIKDHPALLGYYISDETPREQIPFLLDTREKISALDPWHPVWTLTYRVEDLPLYNITGDVLSVDPYPIKANQTSQSLDDMVYSLRSSQRGGQPVWIVPQAFNWMYLSSTDPEKLRQSRGPNAQEMVAMPLLSAALGARGFIYYGYITIFLKMKKYTPEIGDEAWENLKASAKVIKSLEKYILGKEGARELPVAGTDRVISGLLRADDGTTTVLLVALGPEAAKGTVTLPADKEYRSRCGRTKKIAPGVYEFSADAIDYDILEEE